MNQSCVLCVFLAFLLAATGVGLQAGDLALRGSLGALHVNAYDDVFMSWTQLNKFHGRLHADWRPRADWRFYGSVQFRTFQGKWQERYPGFAYLADPPNDYLGLSHSLIRRNELFAQVRMDQAYAEFARGKFALRAGRQRIDVGQTLVWSVSDVFNNVSFFELDPMETGSCDALRISVFPGALSAIEAIVKIDGDKDATGVLKSRTNFKEVDVQVLGGIIRQEDYFLGVGSSFSMRSLNIRSELAYHRPVQQESESRPALLISAGVDHLFANQMMIQAEVLYMDHDDGNTDMHFMDLFSTPHDHKRLSISRWSYVANWHHVRSPKVSMGMTVAHFPDLRGVLFSPTLDLLVFRDVSLVLTGTYFSVERLGIRNEFWLASVRLAYYF